MSIRFMDLDTVTNWWFQGSGRFLFERIGFDFFSWTVSVFQGLGPDSYRDGFSKDWFVLSKVSDLKTVSKKKEEVD